VKNHHSLKLLSNPLRRVVDPQLQYPSRHLLFTYTLDSPAYPALANRIVRNHPKIVMVHTNPFRSYVLRAVRHFLRNMSMKQGISKPLQSTHCAAYKKTFSYESQRIFRVSGGDTR
jgi:hypothetical protein